MLFRKTVFALALIGATIPAAFANGNTGWAGNERGVGIQADANANTTMTSRAEVQKNAQASRKNATTADGNSIFHTERGSKTTQHSYAFQGGSLAHTDRIAHDSASPIVATRGAGKRLDTELYRR